MPRKSLPLGPETLGLIEDARIDLLHAVLAVREGDNEPFFALPEGIPDLNDEAAVDAYRQKVTDVLSAFDPDELRPAERRSRRIRAFANGNPTAIRVVRDHADLTARLEASAPLDAGAMVTFIALAFDLSLPPIDTARPTPSARLRRQPCGTTVPVRWPRRRGSSTVPTVSASIPSVAA